MIFEGTDIPTAIDVHDSRDRWSNMLAGAPNKR